MRRPDALETAVAAAVAALFAVVGSAGVARADTLWVSSGAAANATNALQLSNVTITGVSGDRIVFTTNGREASRDMAQVVRMQIDDDPALSTAEQALANGQLDPAVENYRRVLDASPREWLKLYAARKLAEVAPRANRFDAAAAAYVALLLNDPQKAAPLKPELPDARSTYIPTAIAHVNNVLASPRLSPVQRQAVQGFLLELQRRGGDDKGAAQTAQQLVQSGAATGADAAAAASLAKVRLDAASAALQSKQYARAIDEITAAKSLLNEPRDQAEALYFLAEARAGLAAQKNDLGSWQDASLAYMRVVAHFKESPFGAAYVPRALVKTAQIQEHVKDAAAARSLYEQVIAQYPNDQAAAGAKLALQRLAAER